MGKGRSMPASMPAPRPRYDPKKLSSASHQERLKGSWTVALSRQQGTRQGQGKGTPSLGNAGEGLPRQGAGGATTPLSVRAERFEGDSGRDFSPGSFPYCTGSCSALPVVRVAIERPLSTSRYSTAKRFHLHVISYRWLCIVDPGGRLRISQVLIPIKRRSTTLISPRPPLISVGAKCAQVSQASQASLVMDWIPLF